MSDDEARPTPQSGAAAPHVAPSGASKAAPPVAPQATPPVAPPATPEVMDGIRSLHERLDELQRLVAGRLETDGVRTAGQWLHTQAAPAVQAARAGPARHRPTPGGVR